ncbi:MAG TPA: hypothetical protein VEC14_14850 [Reyranellaceae bacterium]|nr:hypothetical protein [Reyranellaceae bacterium]
MGLLAGILVAVFTGTFFIVAREDRAASMPAVSDWEQYRWLDKTARLLRGEGLGPNDDAEALLKMPREAAVRHFMKDPRFGDAILDFNLFFLGFKIDTLKVDSVYDRTAFDFPNAVVSAQAMMKGGDYLALFDLDSRAYFMPPLRTTPVDDPPLDPKDTGLTAAQLRRKAVGELHDALAAMVEFGDKTLPNNVYDLCNRIMDVTQKGDWWHGRVIRAFDDWEGFGISRGRAITGPLDALGTQAWKECWDKKGAWPDRTVLIAAVQAALARFDRTFAEIMTFEASTYRPRSVAEFRRFDLDAFADQPSWLAFGYEQGLALANSSTNANRRRAAYVLKRFFCDDLTPVGVEQPKQHVTGPLGAASCQSCHYKLDPMGGFFRNYGAFFFDFSQASHVTFDDLAATERQRYVAGWQAPANSSRPWNVGYIRSPANEALNSYGESIADLSKIIRAAPEARQCLMRRLVEYAVADNQAVDGGWLNWLTQRFEEEAARNSSEAMKNAIVRVVTSNAFLQRDADPARCYDQALGARQSEAPPCRVAFLLEKNCARCHDSLKPGTGRLDFTKWKPVPGGGFGFPHVDEQDKPISGEESLARLVARLTTDDPELRMPRGISMSSQDRQELYRWAQEELTKRGKK